MSDITLCLWFDGSAKEAADFYVAAFRDAGREAHVEAVVPWGAANPSKRDEVMVVTFTLGGQQVMGLNGGPQFAFTPALSMVVSCADQGEIDHFWARLSDGGMTGQCGWLTDRFGVSWQVAPHDVGAMLGDPDVARRDRLMAAVMKMQKLDCAAMRTAYEGVPAA